jgi:phage terminase small subunit
MTDIATSAYDALLPKHRAFVDAYREGRSAAEAARLAGYVAQFARWRAHALLRRPDVSAALGQPARRRTRSPYFDPRPRHRAFLDEYCRTWNGARAAIAAGYTAASAARHAHRLLARDDIRAALTERQERTAAASEAEIAEVVATLTHVLRANMLDYMRPEAGGQARFDLSTLTREQAAAISEIKLATRTGSGGAAQGGRAEIAKLRLHDKLKAADKLMRHLGAVKPKPAAPPTEDAAAAPRPPEAGAPARSSRERAMAILYILAKAKAEQEGQPDEELERMMQKAGVSL